MLNQSLIIDRGTPFGTGVKVSLAGIIGTGGAVLAYRRWAGTDELAELFLAVAVGGIAFFFVGMGMLLWRSQVVLDRDAGTGLEWNGVLVPMRRTPFRLDAVRQVLLSKDQFSTRYTSHTVYAARLEGPSKAIVLISDTKEPPVRQAAEDVARYLGVPLIEVAPEV
jgi:hypothetical protein